MIDDVLAVEGVLVQDEVRTLLVARDRSGDRLELELPAGGASEVDAVDRLFRRLQHPAILQRVPSMDLEDVGRVGRYRALPALFGTELLGGHLPSLPAVLRIVERVAGALSAAHAVGVCHRDLHLGQVRLEATGAVRLDGWVAAAVGQRRRRLTLETAASLAPEVLQRRETWAGDVYALGVVAMELIVGERATPASVSRHAGADLLALVKARDPGGDAHAVVRLVRDMLSADWEARPLAMEVVRRCQKLHQCTDLGRYAGTQVPARLASRPSRPGWQGRRLVPHQPRPAPQLPLHLAIATG